MLALGIALSLLVGVSLGFFGGGGSILTVPLLVYVFGLEAKRAIASSLLVVAAASLSGAVQHWRAGNVELRTAATFGAAGMAGAHVGGRLGAWLDGSLLLLLFALMMGFTAFGMWRGRRAPAAGAAHERALGRLVAQGAGVGLFTGLVGAGGGFLIVPALALWAGLEMPVAVGTSLVVIVMNCLAGFAGYASHVDVDAGLVAAVAATAVAGSFVGAALARRVAPASLRRAFAGFVAAMSAFVLVREADAWVATARDALPASAPQAVLTLAVLAVGIATGRVTRRAPSDPLADRALYSEGGGI
ncbi:MAG: sulfite exporter TauE/SafE family protein [Myxococcota bacterium]